LVTKLLSGSLESLKIASNTVIIVAVGILIFESGILSKERFQKLRSIVSIVLGSKGIASKINTQTQSYTNLPIPDELPFEIRTPPESKTIITIPN
jgi:hypothetical protein